jgi:hypothetical protein
VSRREVSRLPLDAKLEERDGKTVFVAPALSDPLSPPRRVSVVVEWENGRSAVISASRILAGGEFQFSPHYENVERGPLHYVVAYYELALVDLKCTRYDVDTNPDLTKPWQDIVRG